MKYALLFYNDPANVADALPPAERDAWFAEMAAWREELQRSGVFRSSLRLARVDAATTLRRDGGEVLVCDGPFADTKEILGGLVVVECADLDEVLAIARRCPIVQLGTLEVRPEFGAGSA